jgi:predicted alpha/beta superfamily hydrolase
MSAMLHGCLADTDYLEVTSKAGHTYGVWVTTPPGYAESTDTLPLVYVLDGNFAVGLTAPLIVTQMDPYLSVAPYIQVSVGYAGDEAAAWAQLRNRDLVPPGEPVSPEMVTTLEAARDAGKMTQEQVDAYLAHLADTHADVFLDFLVNELHPRLQAELRVTEGGHGLFGYSYGGLFALYAWLSGAPFDTVGAGSPGVVDEGSQVFRLVEALDDTSGLSRLHVTVNELEALGPIPIYRNLARNVLDVLERLHARGCSDVVSSAMLQGTHVTGLQASFLSYLTSCRGR